MNVERLENLKRVVRDAPDKLFDMRCVNMETECGTAHCAWGWVKVDPWFNEQVPRISHCLFDDSHTVFGIKSDDADNLFGPGLGPVSKAEVIANIDRVLAGLPALFYGSEELRPVPSGESPDLSGSPS